MSDVPDFSTVATPDNGVPDFASVATPDNGVPDFSTVATQEGQSIGGQVLDAAMWVLRPFAGAGAFAQAPLAHEYKSKDFIGQVGEALTVGASAAVNDLFPTFGSERPNYIGKALEGVNIPDSLRPTAEITASILTDPTFTISGGFAKSLSKSLELAKQTGDFSSPYTTALKDFVSVVPMSPAEALHFNEAAKKADSGDVQATQEMLDNFVLEKTKDKNAIDLTLKGELPDTVPGEVKDIHPASITQSEATVKDVQTVVDNIKAKDHETLKNAQELEPIDQIKLKARVNVMDAVRSERQAAEKLIAIEAKKEAKKVVGNHEVYRLINSIKKSGGFSPDEIAPDLVKVLRKNHGLINKDGQSIIKYAQDHGFEDTDKLLNSLAHIGSEKDAVKEVANAMFKEDVKNARGIADVDMQDRFLAEELRLMGVKYTPDVFKLVQEFKDTPSKEVSDRLVSLLDLQNVKQTGKKAGEQRLPTSSELKTLIRKNTGQTTVSKMITEEQALKAAWKKAEQASRVAFREGGKEAALEERIRFNAYKAAVKDRKLRLKSIKQITRAQKHQGVPLDFMEQMQSVIGGLVPLAKKHIAHAPDKTFEDWLAAKEAEGDDLFAQSIRAEVAGLPAHRNIDEMTGDDLRKFAQFASDMAHAGVIENKFMALKTEMSVNQSINIGIDQIHAIWGSPNEIPSLIELQNAKGKIQTAYSNTDDLVRSLLARNVRPKFIPIALDGEKLDGHMTGLLERPIQNAQREESALQMKVKGQVDAAFSPFEKGFKKWKDSKKEFKLDSGGSIVLTKMKQVMIAANAKSNLHELIHGNGFSEKMIREVIGGLTKQETKLVDDIHATFEQFYEPSNQINIKLTNRRLPKFDGYFPIVEDSKLIARSGGRAKDIFTGGKERDLFSTFQARASNTKGSQRKLRKGGSGALRLDFDVIHNQLNHTIHDVTHALPVRDVQKILANKDMKDAINEALGPHIHQQLVTSLQHVARPIREGASVSERAVGVARSLTTVSILGLNFAVGLKQTLSLSLTVKELGLFPVAKEVIKLWTNPAEFKRVMAAVDSMEPLIAARGKNLDRELADTVRFLVPDKYRDIMFSWIRFNDRLAVYPTYMAAFNKEMKASGDLEKAKRIAMDVLEITQPTNYAKDMAATMRGSEFEKLAKSFMSFFSVFTNSLNRASRQRTLLRKEGKNVEAALQAAKTYWWMIAIPSYLSVSVDKGRPATAKETVNGMLSMRLAGHPLARVLGNAAFGAYDAQITPTTSTIKKMLDGIKDPTEKNVAKIAGFILSTPTKPFIRFGEGMENLYEGNTNNPFEPLLGPPDPPDNFDLIEGK